MCIGGGGSERVPESDTAVDLAQTGAAEWNRFKVDFAPEEKAFIGDMRELGSGRERDMLAGRGINEMKQKAGPVQPGSTRALTRRAMASGEGQSGISTASDFQALERKGKGINTAIGMGRGIATGSLGKLSRQAQLETQENIADTKAENIKQQGLWDLIGTGAGYGAQQLWASKSKDAGGYR